MTADRCRREATLAAPVAVPVTMAAAFAVLRRLLPPRPAYVVGFAVYWAGWCLGFPLWVLGPRGVARVLRAGRRPGPVDVAILAFPVAGAVGAALLPDRRLVDGQVAAVMAGTAAVNAVGEEVLWRGLFLAEFPDDVVRGALWPLAGFTAWHLAPQLVLPSSRGRAGFLLGAAVVGAASTAVAWRTGGLRSVLLPHVLTDACGVRVARFWLGR
ncbi:CPBP family intramembrane glutamic endopeptidase [Geodermatophilus saharensis]|nr:CPBP family intramembrane glutamic endopeptidase [Geodermatophilus saharensis]